MDARGQDALALGVRRSDRAERAPVSPAVIPARRRPAALSPIGDGGSMANRSAETDNHFCPTPADHGSFFTLIAGANLISLAAGLFALSRYAGWL